MYFYAFKEPIAKHMKTFIQLNFRASLILISLFVHCLSFSQTDQFDKVFYNGERFISIRAMAQSESGSILLIGAVSNQGAPNQINGALIQLGPDGTVEWMRALQSPGTTYNIHATASNDGWFVIASQFDTDVFVLKYSIEGMLLWQRGIGFPAEVTPSAICHDGVGGCVLIGSYDYSHWHDGQSMMLVARIGSSGNLLWSHTYSGDFVKSRGVTVRPAGDENFLLTGFLSETSGVAPLIAKITGDGNALWGKKYHSPDVVFGGVYDMINTEMGLALHTYQNESSNDWDVVFCTDPEGEPLWAGKYEYLTQWGWTNFDFFGNIRPLLNTDYEGNLIVSGNTYQSQFIHIGSEGEVIRANMYEMYGIGSLTSPEGNMIVIGNGPVIYVKGYQDYTDPHSGLSKLSPEGQSEKCMASSSYSEFQTVQLEAVPVDLFHSPAGEVFDAILESNELLLTVRDTCFSIIGNISAHDAQSGEQLVITPNPATTEAWLQLPGNLILTQARIELYGPTGILLLRTKPEGNFHRIEAALLPPGLYVVRLWDGKGWKSGRFVVK
jgi:hypothetical protein